MRNLTRTRAIACFLAFVTTVVLIGPATASAATTKVTLSDGKTYEVKLKQGMPAGFKSSDVAVSDLALQARVNLQQQEEASNPFVWMIVAEVFAKGKFRVKATTPNDALASRTFDFTGPGKLAQELFSCAGSPKVCPDFDKPEEFWFLLHLFFEPQGEGQGFELEQWARMSASSQTAAKEQMSTAKKEFDGAATPGADPNAKATVYVYRKGGFAGCGVKPVIWCDEVLLARVSCGKYFMVQVSPGQHVFRSDNPQSKIAIEFGAGRTYYLRADSVPNTYQERGLLFAVAAKEGGLAVQSLKPLPREEIQDATMVVPE
jgi:hypothetical protein